MRLFTRRAAGTRTTVQRPDGTREETTLEAVISQMADELGTLRQEVAQMRASGSSFAKDDDQTGCYL